MVNKRVYKALGSFIALLFVFAGSYGASANRLELGALFLSWQQDPTSTMTIDWHYESDSSSDEIVEAILKYRERGDQDWDVVEVKRLKPDYLPGRARFRTELLNLKPHTAYEFQLDGYDRVFWFQTMPERADDGIRFAVGGDTRIPGYVEEMNRAVLKYEPDFIVWGGDLANANAVDVSRWIDWYRAIKNTLVTTNGRVIPIVTAIGNHEVKEGYFSNHPGFKETVAWRAHIAPFFYGLLAFPGHPGYNVLDFGDYLSLVILDSDHTNPIGGEQTRWLKQVLSERADIAHVIPVYHVSAYPSYRSPEGNIPRRIRSNWIPLFEQYGVRFVFEHHEHAYKRSVPIRDGKPHPDGIVYMGDGGWGEPPRKPRSAVDVWYLETSEQVRHALIVTLRNDALSVESVTPSGVIIDGIHTEMTESDSVERTVEEDEFVDGPSLLRNWNFEDVYSDGTLVGWTASNDLVTRSDTHVSEGRYSVRFSGKDTDNSLSLKADKIRAYEGESYDVTFRAYAADEGSRASVPSIVIDFYDVGDKRLDRHQAWFTGTEGVWEDVTTTAVAPKGTASIVVHFYAGAAYDGTLYLGRVRLTPVT